MAPLLYTLSSAAMTGSTKKTPVIGHMSALMASSSVSKPISSLIKAGLTAWDTAIMTDKQSASAAANSASCYVPLFHAQVAESTRSYSKPLAAPLQVAALLCTA
mmetsp:Transcript_21311/g.34445  ORF Transcript_21311/g.34445 Transcript_21311/m.34445 type:complete len:104 (-) Transcript_21311:74-385(-)